MQSLKNITKILQKSKKIVHSSLLINNLYHDKKDNFLCICYAC